MDLFRVAVCKDGKAWCSIDIEQLHAVRILDDVISRFSSTDGFTVTVVKRVGERRLLESSPDGLKLCYSEPVFAEYVI